MAISWRASGFQKMLCSHPYFYSVSWVRAFLAKLSKKGNFGPPQKEEMLADNWKAHFVFYFGGGCFFFLFFSVFLRVWGPPHLTLNPPCFFCFSFPFFAFTRKTLFFPREKRVLCFSLAFFGLPIFHFLFFCLSLILFFLPSFLSFFIAFFWFLVLVSFFFSFFFAFVSWQ